jgi:four helix bundle protein
MSEFLDHRSLEAWQVAMDTAAVSVPSNVAEGQARGLARACLNQLTIALGSLAEVETQLEIASRLNYVTRPRAEKLQRLILSSRKLIAGLRRAKAARLGISTTGAVCVSLIGLHFFFI